MHFLSIFILVSIFITGCLEEGETIQITKKKTPSSEGDPNDNGNTSNENEGNNPANPSIIFEDDFEYALSDLTTKWTTVTKHGNVVHEISTNNGSKGWAAYYTSSHWGGSIVSKQTFNLPVTIEWDQHQVSSAMPTSTTSMEGICIYEGGVVRNSYYYYVQTATDYGCFRFYRNTIMTYPIVYPEGIFYNTDDPTMVDWGAGLMGYHLSGVYVNYRTTLTIREDLTYDFNVQFIDNPAVNDLQHSGVIPVGNTPTNFYIEFNNGDYNAGKTFFDNIKVWDGEVDPTPI